MTDSLDVDVLGLRARIELPAELDDAQRKRIRTSWSGASSDGDGDADVVVLLQAELEFEQAMERLTVDVTLAALDALRGKALLFHAAGVADPDGRVAAFVGPSGRGKTTLSRALGRHHAYVSDETVAVRPDLSVSAYRKPLSVVRDGAPKDQISPADAGLQPLPEVPLRLQALLLMDRDASLAGPEIVPLPLAEALPELVPQMSYLRDQEHPLQTIAALGDALGGFRLLRYPEAAMVPPLLGEILDAPPAASDWSPVPDAAELGPYDCSEVADAICVDHHVIVMARSVVHVLDGIAPAIWLAARSGADLDRVVEAVEHEYGAPPEGSARALVTEALDELLASGVLSRRGAAR